MLTNRPDYAPDRRPGDPIDITTTATDLVTLHTTTHDAPILAALLKTGAAALEHAPGTATDVVELNRRQRNITLGRDAASALYAETTRLIERDNERHLNDARRHRAAQRFAARRAAGDTIAEAAERAATLEHVDDTHVQTAIRALADTIDNPEPVIGPWEAT